MGYQSSEAAQEFWFQLLFSEIFMLISDNFYLTSLKFELRSKSSNWTFILSNAVPVKMKKVRFWIVCHNPAFTVKVNWIFKVCTVSQDKPSCLPESLYQMEPAAFQCVRQHIAFEETHFMDYICLNTLVLWEQNPLCFCLQNEGNTCPELPQSFRIPPAQDKYQ